MNHPDIDIAALRENYTRGGIDREDLHHDPLVQFRSWLADAVAAKLPEPNAMALATVSPDGQPSVRTVLLKGLDERGFRFFTNYRSHKGKDLQGNPKAGLSFLWKDLERQVNIEGEVEEVPREESAEYFASRPYGSQIGAWVSEVQSAQVSHRKELEARENLLKTQYPEGEKKVPLPDFWGGYVLRPKMIEFWQGRESRLHDRLEYRRTDTDWQITRLSP